MEAQGLFNRLKGAISTVTGTTKDVPKHAVGRLPTKSPHYLAGDFAFASAASLGITSVSGEIAAVVATKLAAVGTLRMVVSETFVWGKYLLLS